MKTPTLLATLSFSLSLALAGLAHAGSDHGHAQAPQHGGVVAEAKGKNYELVAKPSMIQLHLRDHGKPVDLAQASARLTLLSGSAQQVVDLKPAGDRLEAAGSFQVAPGTKVVAMVTLAGKPAGAVRFVLK